MSKKIRRMEAKKRKAEAFLQIAKLNDEDRIAKKVETEAKRPKPDQQTPPRLTSKPLLSGESYEELRAKLRERKKLLKSLPDFGLKTGGENASVEIPANLRTPLFAADVQRLLMYLMVGDKMPWATTKWCRVDKWNKFANVVCVVAENCGFTGEELLTARDVEGPARRLDGLLKHKLAVVSPASYDSTFAQDLMMVAASNKRKRMLESAYGSLSDALDKGAAFNFHRSVFPMKKDVGVGTSPSKEPILTTTDHPLRMRLLLSARQMVDEGYPFRLPGVQQEKLSDYVFTQELYEEVSGDSPMFSVDCEMVMTTAGKMELARICVIDETLAVVYHSFVKPSNPVTNYLTRFSGITKALLEDVEVTLAEVQAEMRRLLPADAILIGQSLNSDLHAMEMMHPYVIDTSVIYNLTGARGRKTKLSVLSERFLGERIQFMGRSGHDPKEDAIAAMKLVKLKLEKGYEYGDAILDGGASEEPLVPENVVLSVADELQTKSEKSLQLVCQESVADQYLILPGYGEGDLTRVKGDWSEASESGCESAGKNDLVLCHVDMEGGDGGDERWERAASLASKFWDKVSDNGLLLTLLCAPDTVMMGISFRKGKVPVPTIS